MSIFSAPAFHGSQDPEIWRDTTNNETTQKRDRRTAISFWNLEKNWS